MALTDLTKVTGPGIHTLSNVLSHNIKSSGIITATKFSGPLDSIGGNFAGVITATNGVFSGNISAVDGTFTGNVSIGGTLTYEDVTNIDSVGIITAQKDIHVGGGVSAIGVGTFSGLDISGDIDVDGHTNLDNVSIAGVTTFTGGIYSNSSINLGGELNFTGNGHKYIDVATLNGSNTLTIRHQDGGSYETAAYFDANGGGYLQFNGNTKFATTNTGVNITGTAVATGADTVSYTHLTLPTICSV